MIRRCLLPLVLLLGGCADTLFVDAPINAFIDKTEDRVAKYGNFQICHDSATPMSEIQALADEECGRLGWQSQWVHTQKWQCRLTAPHMSTFQCFVPGYVDQTGKPVNPANKKAFLKWQQSQKQAQKGDKAGVTPLTGTPAAPAGSVGEPAVSTRPLTPADIAGKPSIPGAPLPVEPAPVQGAYPSGGFTITPGGWGEHFQD